MIYKRKKNAVITDAPTDSNNEFEVVVGNNSNMEENPSMFVPGNGESVNRVDSTDRVDMGATNYNNDTKRKTHGDAHLHIIENDEVHFDEKELF